MSEGIMTDPTDHMETAREIADQFAALTVTDHNVRRAFAETCAAHIATALTAARKEGRDTLEQELWAIIDRDGLGNVPSDIHDAVDRLARRSSGHDTALQAAERRGMERAADIVEDAIEAMCMAYSDAKIEVWIVPAASASRLRALTQGGEAPGTQWKSMSGAPTDRHIYGDADGWLQPQVVMWSDWGGYWTNGQIDRMHEPILVSPQRWHPLPERQNNV